MQILKKTDINMYIIDGAARLALRASPFMNVIYISRISTDTWLDDSICNSLVFACLLLTQIEIAEYAN